VRGSTPGLTSPHPIVERLPALYAEDDFTERFLSAFDDVLAPVFATLDCLPAYLDPLLAPADFVDWLAGWVGLDLDDAWPLALRRELIARAVALHRRRGTPAGLVELVSLVTGGEVEVTESGGVAWSAPADTALPGHDDPFLHLRVRVTDPEAVDTAALHRLVATSTPAHVPVTVDVLPT
jgi:phage tail-like protein